jgi:hypothetical protein
VSEATFVEHELANWGARSSALPFFAPDAWRPASAAPSRRPTGRSERVAVIELMESVRELVAATSARESLKPSTKVRPRVEERFAALAEGWRRETLLESSVTRMAIHKAYQQIIGLGMPAVPLILRELEREPNYWFWALTSITGQDPAAGEDTLEGATQRWLEWGRANDYI